MLKRGGGGLSIAETGLGDSGDTVFGVEADLAEHMTPITCCRWLSQSECRQDTCAIQTAAGAQG